MAKILVSSCLIGCECRYKGDGCACEEIIALGKEHQLIPVCPEQMGGLTTPRNPSEIVNGRLLMNDGTDVTKQYQKGAKTALYLAKTLGADFAILKAKSPSCGKGLIYDGTFTGNKIPGNGVTAQLLLDNGIEVFTEEELEKLPIDK